MDWNLLLKRTNEIYKKEIKDEIIQNRLKISRRAQKLNDDIKDYRKTEPKLYRLKDRFNFVYPLSFTILFILAIPIIIGSFFLKSPLTWVILIVYVILTLPLGLVSFLAPTVKFFSYDLGKVLDEAKIYFNNDFIVAIFFKENRVIVPILSKVDNEGVFQYRKLPYITDKSANFISVGKVVIAFYIEGLPNPLKFNFRKYIEEYIQKKKENPDLVIRDFDGQIVDVAFTSANLRDYKRAKIFEAFFTDDAEKNAQFKLLLAIIGFAGTVSLIMFIMYILK